jgi:hypothetical protein
MGQGWDLLEGLGRERWGVVGWGLGLLGEGWVKGLGWWVALERGSEKAASRK